MRPPWRSTLPPELLRSIALVCLADTVVALAFGAVTVGAGLPVWLPIALSVLVFAGAAQFLFVAVVTAGGSPFAAAAAALLVNARLVPLGLAVGDLLGPGWLRRLVGTHVVTDESVAFTTVQAADAATVQPQGTGDHPDAAAGGTENRRAAFWTCGVALFVCWNAGVLTGALGGRLIPDTDALGLDAAFPAVLLALAVPALRDRRTMAAALAGAAVALATAPWLPAGIPVVLALAGLLVVRR